MIELRKSRRINVTWRGLLKLSEGKFASVRVFNVSETGLLILSEQGLMTDRDYQLMVEIPHIDPLVNNPFKVSCKVAVLHSILSGDAYRVGVRITQIAELHRDLINAWISMSKKQDPAKEQ